MKKKNLFVTTTLVSALVFSAFAPTGFAHDDLDTSGLEKGEVTVFTNEQLESLALPKVEGSKNVSNLTEAAQVQIKQIREGVQNNTADVYAHKGFAYMGTHTANGGNGGVRVFDLKDPSNPVEVSVFANDDVPGTWQEKVIVKTVNTPHFKGDLAVVSVQQLSRTADTSGGFLLYDVTDPYSPKKLGFWEVYSETPGTHELYLETQGDKALVFASNPYADYYSHGEEKDFQIVDVSNPAEPETLWEFDPRMVEGVPDDFNGYNWKDPQGKSRAVFNHSVMVDDNAQYAYVSMWDLGTVILDIKDPENPVYLGRTEFASDQQGSAHSSTLAQGGNLLIETREVYVPVKPGYEQSYGYTRIFDIKDKANPKLLSEFKTDLVDNVEDGVTFANTVHDPKVRGNTLYLSHYAGGVYMVDITNPSKPVQIGQYTPDRGYVWGVFVDKNYVLASDMGQGLKVLTKNNKAAE
ncbi:LVIVD repeat-containing protein [Bacillus salacetis]|uniref:LVIVD repeat-containing protein n=1 Tax=Bacillus salacetis TaxID=2315464 RepID=UPI003BA2BB92